jgi:hypothetical protein
MYKFLAAASYGLMERNFYFSSDLILSYSEVMFIARLSRLNMGKNLKNILDR